MNRKTFFQKTTAGLLLGITLISILGCSGSDDGGPTTPNPNPNSNPSASNCLENGTHSSVSSSAGHSHSLTVSKEDISAGVEKTYDLSNVDNHIHQVTISAAQFQSLQSNNSIDVMSTSDSGHTHGVTVSCS